MSSVVTCAQCRHFTRDQIGFGQGIGSCSPFEDWLNKFPRRRPKPRDYDNAFSGLGGKVFYPDSERHCSKYEAIVLLDQPISKLRKREYF